MHLCQLSSCLHLHLGSGRDTPHLGGLQYELVEWHHAGADPSLGRPSHRLGPGGLRGSGNSLLRTGPTALLA